MMTVSSSRNSEAAVLGAAAKSIESVKGGEMLMGALDLVESELAQAPEVRFCCSVVFICCLSCLSWCYTYSF